VLVQQKFSRDFEREADDFAFDQLRRLAIPTQAFPTMLRRLDQQRGSGSGVTAYLSTHPATEDRIARFGSGR
jgi:predicted Zn-dependent protease